MKSKILLALTLLLGASTTIWAVGNSGKANQKKHAYTNEDVWAAYDTKMDQVIKCFDQLESEFKIYLQDKFVLSKCC